MNIWTSLKSLLPESPLLLGIVSVDHGGGSYTLDLVGGGSLKAFGSGFSVGNTVYVRGTVIEGAAPSLPTYVSEV